MQRLFKILSIKLCPSPLTGNFVAIATMDPTIDIWDLDLIDSLEPLATLGHRPKKKKKVCAHFLTSPCAENPLVTEFGVCMLSYAILLSYDDFMSRA